MSCLSSSTLLGRWGPPPTHQGGCPGNPGPELVQTLPGPTWMNAWLLALTNVPTLPPMVMEGGTAVWNFSPNTGDSSRGWGHRVQDLWRPLMRNAHLSSEKPKPWTQFSGSAPKMPFSSHNFKFHLLQEISPEHQEDLIRLSPSLLSLHNIGICLPRL